MSVRPVLMKSAAVLSVMAAFAGYFGVIDNPKADDPGYELRQRIYQFAHGVFSDGGVGGKGRELYEQRQYPEARRWLEFAAQRADGDAMYLLGKMYLAGDGVDKNAQKGVELLSQAGRKGKADALLLLANVYQNGTGGVTQDLAESSRWLLLASELGNGEAQGLLGDHYARGLGVKQNWLEASNWTKKGAEAGDSFAQANMGKLLYQGYGGPRDIKAATEWLGKAAAQKNGHALLTLADIAMAENDADKARQYVKAAAAADVGDPEIQYRLGNHNASGQVIDKNSAEAVAYYFKSAKQNHGPGCHQLGLSYLRGDGVAHDQEEGLRWLEKAAQAGTVDAAFDLGFILWSGAYGVSKDERRAFGWFSKAADQGSAKAGDYVGLALIKGIGVAKNIAKGTEILEGQASRGDETAKAWLAEVRAADAAAKREYDERAAADIKAYQEAMNKTRLENAMLTCPQGNYKLAADYRRDCPWLNGSKVALTHQERTARDTAFGVYRYLETTERRVQFEKDMKDARARMDTRIDTMLARRR